MPTFNQNNGVFTNSLKTLSELKSLSAEDNKLITAFNLLIAKGPKIIEKQVLPALASYTLSDLFKLSEGSTEIKNLCQKAENQNLWQDRFNNLNYPVQVEVNSTFFDKLMGAYLAHHYETYEEAGRSNSTEAKKFLREARLRGLNLGNELVPNVEDSIQTDSHHVAAPAA